MEFETGENLLTLKGSFQGQFPAVTAKISSSNIAVDEYAQYNGLTIDSLGLDPWPGSLNDGGFIAASSHRLEDEQLIELKELTECLFRPIIPTPEQWQAPIKSLQFLQKQLPQHRLPLHPTNANKGEGLEFPDSSKHKHSAIIESLEKETLEVNRDTLGYLVQILKENWSEGDRRDFVESISTYTGVGDRECFTPLVSPHLQPQQEYFIPDEESCELAEPSDTSLGISAELEATESRIFEQDLEFWAEIGSKPPPSPEGYKDIDVSHMIKTGELSESIFTASPLPVSRDLKMDVPFLLCERCDDGIANQPLRIMGPEDLAQAKALAVAVPVVDFSLPAPQWETQLWDSRRAFVWIRSNTLVDWQGPKWPANRISEQRMVWAPLAHMGHKTLVSEKIETEESVLEPFIKIPREKEVLKSADYIEKRPGLAILRMDDDDNDDDGVDYEDGEVDLIICHDAPTNPPSTVRVVSTRPFQQEAATVPAEPVPPAPVPTRPLPQDLTALVKGRKRQIEELSQKRTATGEQVSGFTTASESHAFSIDQAALRGFLNEYTDFSPLVDNNFIELNFPKKPKLTHSFYSGPQKTIANPSDQNALQRLTPKGLDRLLMPPPKPIQALAPEFTLPPTPPRVVVAFTVSNILTSHLEKLLPGADLVLRDYQRHRPTRSIPHNQSPSNDEADIILSPATGVMMTTMIRLRQKPIPGKAARQLPFCQVVENIAARYERLIIMVSEGNKHSETMSPPSQSDANALVEFRDFAAGIRETDIQVMYAGGGSGTLARWIAAAVCKHASEALPVQHLLLQEETCWELFLRRAGMNVYAAHVVLGTLKLPDGEQAIGGKQLYGLPQFVAMTREKRLEIFEELFGGRRLLDRVSSAIDEPRGQRVVDEGRFLQ
ncbi:hypothetical protein B0T26DRAFT_796174 [Lasiosphaeria miniovina]|uniref:Uncharacterized protein n=1 Tax=Lasiosphaeria miniovina TaxID=1954250 RepID=A0AA39ZR83_9PEZI|nr:uncharacterized protein B0T26DRAFT_796174 [Lasiosphaeria miniovina]KAK0702088.1 hypothetical protein B0T26DRAFT_796174 [Lasiosphaeria miniovina]